MVKKESLKPMVKMQQVVYTAQNKLVKVFIYSYHSRKKLLNFDGKSESLKIKYFTSLTIF